MPSESIGLDPKQALPAAAATAHGSLADLLNCPPAARGQVRIHLVGIGGAGLSAIAGLLL